MDVFKYLYTFHRNMIKVVMRHVHFLNISHWKTKVVKWLLQHNTCKGFAEKNTLSISIKNHYRPGL
jgi:hypothetical protein